MLIRNLASLNFEKKLNQHNSNKTKNKNNSYNRIDNLSTVANICLAQSVPSYALFLPTSSTYQM